jgi:hypothetical protein
MTQAKKLKRAIRARARETGESYTTARRHVLKARERAGKRWKTALNALKAHLTS